MNKLLIAGLFFAGIATATAQQTAPGTKVEVVKTETPKQAVHNALHPHHKHYSGYKIKKKTRHGRKYVKVVDKKAGTVTVKTKVAGSPDKTVVTKPIR